MFLFYAFDTFSIVTQTVRGVTLFHFSLLLKNSFSQKITLNRFETDNTAKTHTKDIKTVGTKIRHFRFIF